MFPSNYPTTKPLNEQCLNLKKPFTIALTSHAGQEQKNGDPYVLHPLHLMCQMETETERIVAVLHDVIEDTEMTLDDLAASGFSAEIITNHRSVDPPSGAQL